ncbi:tRNA (adenosine(37)-N6)-threonylcarbamoyltransferase complex ATPase subunit type 1 TsaE [Rhodophyticola porphyridii]|uniref:tRNA (adenosine(37)-N6)-threonylcarbamoyltransferase complex ATPase subunit type 1 TsaE n=1 Tax=Rhodophyticola porphyridii TaxID=1852017 RepID=UPI001B0A4D56|nr:tRNA (adenosine(37)-N6)-threonylcarbamoyltransferase complex ATPase subunit type 1 TsaE [Roseicyclus sp.]MBO6625136.1 tRNA (adenosine(37)-N6)-threonylcarbamoyltransferase complex ATPase subunit type 1 TsaE [Roseicyclus sp.]MBO6923083.1 tRNA (adenosine(37)-N6)-threonylcarbamoyltransferase complex ATPase subunit type 1 TsaE [Roseicyclus sp.]
MSDTAARSPELPCLARWVSTSPEATAAMAARIGAELRAGDVILLAGDLGSGKTHFARALIQSRQAEHGTAEDVPSPSFTLVQTYQAGDLEIWHCDLYRLTGADDALELGLEEAFSDALCLIEWPDRLAGRWPEGAAWLVFSHDPETPDRRGIALHMADDTALAARLARCLEAG